MVHSAPESRLEAIARENYANTTGFPSFMDYHIFSMQSFVEEQWQLLEYTIACILARRKDYSNKKVYNFLKAYPWTKETPIAVNMNYFEFGYSWNYLILSSKAKPRGCSHPDILLCTIDEGQIHRLDTQFRYWRAAGERAWEDHFADMSPHMWFGPQGQERQRRLSIPGFSDEV